MRLALVASLLLLSASSSHAGSHNAGSYDIWGIPQILVQPGSPVIVVLNIETHEVVIHDDGDLFGSPTDSVERTILQTTYQTLDVRNCRVGPVLSYRQAVEQFGWGDAPGELWIQRADHPDVVELLGGGGRIPLGRVPTDRWKQPPLVSAGMIQGPGVLRVWDLSHRAVRDTPFVRDGPLEAVLPVRVGDQNVVALAPGKDHQSLDVVAVSLGASGTGAPVTTHFQGRFKGPQLVHGGNWLVLPSDAAPGGSVPAKNAAALLVADVRTGKVVRRVRYRPEHGGVLIDADRLWFAHLVGGACGDLEVVDLERNTRAKLPVAGCANGVQPWSAGAPFVAVTIRNGATQLVDVRSGHVLPFEAAPPNWSALVGDAFFKVDGPQEVSGLDLATGQRWRAVASTGGTQSISAVPSARRIVIVNGQRSIWVYDVDARRVSKCM